MERKEKGITLIALVVTIVVLLILAGVSISMLTGENGIIKQAQEANDATEQAKVEELVDIAMGSLISGNEGSTNGITPDDIAKEVNRMENREDVYAKGDTFPTEIIFPEEGDREVHVDLSQKEEEEDIYNVPVDEEDIAPMELFDYEIIEEAEVGATNLSSLPTKKAKITRIKPKYCNVDGYNPDTGNADLNNTNYEIIHPSIDDTLIIPYQVDGKHISNGTEGEMYTITEVDLRITQEDREIWTNMPSIETIIYPNTVTKIYSASDGRSPVKLKNIIFSDKIEEIPSNFLRSAAVLTKVTLPKSLTSIGYSAFESCSGLTSIEIPNSVTSIGYSAFEGCSGLTSIEISESVTSIERWAFSGCSGLTSIEIPNSVTSIGGSAFSGCYNLTSITLPSNVQSIGYYAFEYCRGLTSIEIPESVTNIGDYTFKGCTGLTNITIPESVTNVGEYAFRNWTSSQTINVPFKEKERPDGWSSKWNADCEATIKYKQ